jgi:hypothetical protein
MDSSLSRDVGHSNSAAVVDGPRVFVTRSSFLWSLGDRTASDGLHADRPQWGDLDSESS